MRAIRAGPTARSGLLRQPGGFEGFGVVGGGPQRASEMCASDRVGCVRFVGPAARDRPLLGSDRCGSVSLVGSGALDLDSPGLKDVCRACGLIRARRRHGRRLSDNHLGCRHAVVTCDRGDAQRASGSQKRGNRSSGTCDNQKLKNTVSNCSVGSHAKRSPWMRVTCGCSKRRFLPIGCSYRRSIENSSPRHAAHRPE